MHLSQMKNTKILLMTEALYDGICTVHVHVWFYFIKSQVLLTASVSVFDNIERPQTDLKKSDVIRFVKKNNN